MGAKTEPSCFPKLPDFENCPDAHYSTEILIQCGHTTREFVALAGASGDPLDQAGLGTFVLEASWAVLALQALRELSDVLGVGSGSLRKPGVFSFFGSEKTAVSPRFAAKPREQPVELRISS